MNFFQKSIFCDWTELTFIWKTTKKESDTGQDEATY